MGATSLPHITGEKMKVEDLKHYGCPMSETMLSIPKRVKRGIERKGLSIVRKHLGHFGTLRLLVRTEIEKRRMKKIDISPVRRKGQLDEEFIDTVVGKTALFSALQRLVGVKKALDIHYEIMDAVAGDLMTHMLPGPEDFNACGDPFAAAKSYIFALMEADGRVGAHLSEVVEDSPDAFQVNVTYCAWCEIPKLLGVPESALPDCYGDDVFFPAVSEEIGLGFKRVGTIARGDRVCDFRFERMEKKK
jgi:hypothetical protein